LKHIIERIPIHSIRFKLFAAAFAILLTLWVYFLYNNIYAISVVRKQVANSNKNLVTLYMQTIDYRLNSVEKFLANTLSNNNDLRTMQYSTDEFARDIAKTKAFQQLLNAIAEYDYVNCLFVYAANTGNYFSVYSLDSVPYDTKQKTNSTIKDLIDSNPKINETINQGFFTLEIEQKYYIFRILREGSMYIGAWVSADYLQIPLKLINFGKNGTSLFVTSDYKPMNNISFIRDNDIILNNHFESYYMTGQKEDYLVVGEKSSHESFSLVALIPDKAILENLGYFQQIAFIMSTIFILLIILYVIFIRKAVFTPLKHIMRVMNRIHDGDIDKRITYQSKSEEFATINETFNNMMNQIKELKINVYEEQISKQKEELERLKLQISPHFFMNSLYIIYGLAQVKDYKLIQEMSLCLSKYFSYISRKNMTLVKLYEEVEHIKNYLRIQDLRYPNGFIYEIRTPDDLLEVLVPPLVIQTFIENIMKYALTMDEPIKIAIIVSPEELKDSPGIKITISNTGSWIREDILEKLHAVKRIVDEEGEHIGIWNIQRRLELIYSGRAKITFNNVEPKGVVIDIVIPIQI